MVTPPNGADVVIKCQKCGYDWATRSEARLVTCPACQYKTERNEIGYEYLFRGKFLFTSCESIEDMVAVLEDALLRARKLADDGWVLSHGARDDYCFLRYPKDISHKERDDAS